MEQKICQSHLNIHPLATRLGGSSSACMHAVAVESHGGGASATEAIEEEEEAEERVEETFLVLGGEHGLHSKCAVSLKLSSIYPETEVIITSKVRFCMNRDPWWNIPMDMCRYCGQITLHMHRCITKRIRIL